MMDDNKLYSINELILWLEHPSQQWSGNRPLMYAKYARAELAQLQAIATAAREVNNAFAKGSDFKMFDGSPCWCGRTDRHSLFCQTRREYHANLAAALAALEQETK